MAVCLVTGGAGFIGSHLVEALVARHDRVRVLDDFSSGSWANLENVRSEIELITGDVSDPQTVRTAVDGVDVIFHLACATAATGSATDPLAIHHSTATGTLHVLKAARDAQVSRVVYAGAASVYQDDDEKPRREIDPTLPRSMYGAAKLAAEHYCLNFSRLHGLETVRLRYFEVIGPRQPADGPHASAPARFLDRMKGGLGPLIAGDGKQTRDFTYVEDVVQANLLAANAPRVSGKVFNIASGRAATLLDLADVLNTVLRANFAPIHVAPQDGEPRHLQANIERAQTELGFCPCTDLARDAHRCFGDTDTPLPARAAVTASAVPAPLPDFRPDGPMRSILNPPHHRRDRTYRRL
jgi:UDP-glucose 4-epimerase